MTDSTRTTSPGAPLTGARAGADKAYMWLLLLFLLAGLVQIFLAGLGVFDLDGRELDEASSFDAHKMLGDIMGAAALLLLILSLVARPNRRTVVMVLLLAILTSVFQSVLANVGEDTPFFGGLHALDGLIIIGLGGFLHAEARRRNSTD